MAFILVGGAILLALAVFFVLPRLQAPAPTSNGTNTQNEAGVPFPEIERVSLEDAHAHFLDKSVVILDVRSAEEFAQAHIPDAISMPVTQVGIAAGPAVA
jgi:hypothetical protein